MSAAGFVEYVMKAEFISGFTGVGWLYRAGAQDVYGPTRAWSVLLAGSRCLQNGDYKLTAADISIFILILNVVGHFDANAQK